MELIDLYNKEMGRTQYTAFDHDLYVKWLEFKLIEELKPTIFKWIKNMFLHAKQKEWYETYFAIDIHGTVSKPDYRKTAKEIEYYDNAKETLQLLTKRKDIILIMSTSSYPEEIKQYVKQFEDDGIVFNYINENPEISSDKGSFGYYVDKYYVNAILDDKAGFNPYRDWKYLYRYFLSAAYKPDPKWSMKKVETYHK